MLSPFTRKRRIGLVGKLYVLYIELFKMLIFIFMQRVLGTCPVKIHPDFQMLDVVYVISHVLMQPDTFFKIAYRHQETQNGEKARYI